ncbi:hypothetical protein A3L09_05570 [Thermococcus profundus]|uniref:Uncharacterized protein n=1 Tax=Thermococcus profundus TaxID=49899 RepID=A0A2Z2M8Y1_THEPR|nr:hypothetical protein [Thermococcus profundus]ASJ02757.1 hypothetical protein A3L09_05570 [Thermococcus profundus]
MRRIKETLGLVLSLLILVVGTGTFIGQNIASGAPAPEPVITGMDIQPVACWGYVRIGVSLNNYGGTTAVGTLKIYVDGIEKYSGGFEVHPYTPTVEEVSLRVFSGQHSFKAEIVYPGGISSKTQTATLELDADCDGIMDLEDMDPFGDARIMVYVLRAKAIDAVPDPILHSDPDMSVDITARSGDWDSSKTLNFKSDTKDTESYTGKIVPGIDILGNLQNYAVGEAVFDVPDSAEIVDITFQLRDRDDDPDDPIDISPGPGNAATIHYNLRTGTWSGDDYPGDEKQYYGYGHLSGCGDGSCGISAHDPGKDVKVYSKYENILKKNGINGKVISAVSPEGVKEVRGPSKRGWVQVSRPRSVELVTVELPNGKLKNFTLVNTHGARVSRLLSAMSPGSPQGDVVLSLGGKKTKIKGQVVTYSSDGAPDGEIWFVVTVLGSGGEGDGIPYWREVELNEELEAAGLPWRFDPTDGYYLNDDSLRDESNDNDSYGDYDGDGVPNIVELMIGKDPAKRDILGISLKVSTEWPLSEGDKKNLIYSIRKASDFVYDYTDGYAMITSVQIWDNKRHWNDADVRVHETGVLPQTEGEFLYQGWPRADPGGYWRGGHIMMSKKFERYTPPTGTASIGDVRWGRTLAHELGHYVFWLGDEYMDWRGNSYYWNYITCDDFACYFDRDVYYAAPDSVMKHEWSWSELSTPKDYEEFHQFLTDKYGDWKPYTTYQWAGDMDPQTQQIIEQWTRSAWETLYTILTGSNEPPWLSKLDYMKERPLLNINLRIDENFTPKTGPYTGVGYFMEVTWG